jgi:hypothetical protein
MPTKPIIVEYLIIIKQEDTFCDNNEAFVRFLGVDSSIIISPEKNELTFHTQKRSKFKVSYTLTGGLVPSKKERFFKLTLSSEHEDKLNEFTELTKNLENVIKRLHTDVNINVLWNDIARKYAVTGYEAINEVENLLRRLITSFMLINVGYDWYKFHIPKSVEDRDGHLKQNYSNYLHQTYFSDLKTILFEGQRDPQFRDIGEVQLFVQRAIAEKKTNLKVEELKGVIATSLWEKYFAKDTNYKKQDLDNDLESLNTLRNEIAHNRHISRETLGKVQAISKKIIQTLKLEIDDLPNKVLSREEQEFQIGRELVRMSNTDRATVGYFAEQVVSYWYKTVYKNVNVNTIEGIHDPGYDLLVLLENETKIAVTIKTTTIEGVRNIRNKLAHTMFSKLLHIQGTEMINQVDLVIVLLDYSPEFKIRKLLEIEELFQGIHPSVRLILGYINNAESFIPINLVF